MANPSVSSFAVRGDQALQEAEGYLITVGARIHMRSEFALRATVSHPDNLETHVRVKLRRGPDVCGDDILEVTRISGDTVLFWLAYQGLAGTILGGEETRPFFEGQILPKVALHCQEPPEEPPPFCLDAVGLKRKAEEMDE